MSRICPVFVARMSRNASYTMQDIHAGYTSLTVYLVYLALRDVYPACIPHMYILHIYYHIFSKKSMFCVGIALGCWYLAILHQFFEKSRKIAQNFNVPKKTQKSKNFLEKCIFIKFNLFECLHKFSNLNGHFWGILGVLE